MQLSYLGGVESEPSAHVPAIYVAKYNRFVDQILGKINNILRANYEPVTVKLTNSNLGSKSNKNKNKGKRKGNKKNGTKKSASRPIENASAVTEKSVDENVEKVTQTTELAVTETAAVTEKETISSLALESSTEANVRSRRTSGSNNSSKNRKRTKNKTKTKKGTTGTAGSSNKNKTKTKSTRPKARATLYGLASLQRSGDVSVNMMSDHTTIKTRFSLGPLVLKVEKEFGRAAKKELRSATATTAEMSGKLSLRVLHGGAATLHSIRVLQPKQVRVESQDDHDRTREFVWKRSSHIAHLVSQKLSSATRSMLRPPPVAPAA
ncbi:unnamed protein product [Lasius platythorax]|uniref:Uncharacterized protein n=1 Tax=Lasius platythorax TaxID=488582 RepID=A0AAV2P3F2_9HYME